jgi:hypothetical protein
MSKKIEAYCSNCHEYRGMIRGERCIGLCKKCSNSARKKEGIYKNREWLFHNYIVLNKSQTDIAKECNVSFPSIFYFLKKYNIVKETYNIKNSNIDNAKKQCYKKHGVENPFQIPIIVKQISKKVNNACIIKHWKTNEELICQGSWERKVVDSLNKKQIDFIWQIPFKLSNGKTYYCDLFLIEENKYVEIKGYERPDFKEKWSLFCKEYSFLNKEIWKESLLKSKGIL